MKNEKNRTKKYTVQKSVLHPPFEFKISIKPFIETRSDTSGEEFHLLYFRIRCNRDGPIDEFSVAILDWNDKEPFEWTLKYIEKQQQYLAAYVGGALVQAAQSVCQEANSIHATKQDFEKDFAGSKDLKALDESYGGRYTAGKPLDSGFQYAVARMASAMRDRLTGRAQKHIGARHDLRYSDEAMEHLSTLYPDRLAIWQRANGMYLETFQKDKWQEALKRRIKAECEGARNADDDLLDALLSGAYETWQIAIVDAARLAGLHDLTLLHPWTRKGNLYPDDARTIKRKLDRYEANRKKS